MMNVYNIIVSKKNVKSDVVGDYLKKVFSCTWELVKNKKGEAWYCARETPVNIDDFVTAIKCLHKDITGVLVSNINISAMSCDKDGYFYETPGTDPAKYPGTERIMKILMNIKD